MKQVGYIVQYLDEESLNPNGPGKRLYTRFEEALIDAKELIMKWYETNTEKADGPVEYYEVTQAIVDNQHSALVFRSAWVFIWIEIIYTV